MAVWLVEFKVATKCAFACICDFYSLRSRGINEWYVFLWPTLFLAKALSQYGAYKLLFIIMFRFTHV